MHTLVSRNNTSGLSHHGAIDGNQAHRNQCIPGNGRQSNNRQHRHHDCGAILLVNPVGEAMYHALPQRLHGGCHGIFRDRANKGRFCCLVHGGVMGEVGGGRECGKACTERVRRA